MKKQDISQLTVEDLQDRIENTMETLKKLIANHRVSPLENPIQIRATRREIARLNTELSRRNLGV